jgi:hypothetical protein
VDETVPRRARINDSDALAVEINLFRHTYNHIRPPPSTRQSGFHKTRTAAANGPQAESQAASSL